MRIYNNSEKTNHPKDFWELVETVATNVRDNEEYIEAVYCDSKYNEDIFYSTETSEVTFIPFSNEYFLITVRDFDSNIIKDYYRRYDDHIGFSIIYDVPDESEEDEACMCECTFKSCLDKDFEELEI